MTSFSDTVILISALGTRGDIHPLIGIALELKQRGADVTFLVSDYFKELIEGHGLNHVSTGTRESYIEFHSDPRIWRPSTDVAELGWQRTGRPALKTAYEYVLEAQKRHEKLLVLGIQPLFNGALMAAEALSIPSVNFTLAPQNFPSYLAPPAPLNWLLPYWIPQKVRTFVIKKMQEFGIRAAKKKDYFWEYNGLRTVFGLKHVKNFEMDTFVSDRHLQIGLFPNWYGMPAKDWPSFIHMTGYPLFDEIKTKARPVVDKFIEGRGKPIVFTSGTGVLDTEEMFTEGREICRLLGVPGLFVGGEVDEREFSTDENILHVDYVDFEHIFRHCLAVVHHGGIGTLAQAAKAGVPQFVRPRSFDQFDNADRVRRLHLGSFTIANRFKAKRVAPLIRKIISSDQIKGSRNFISSAIKRDQAINKTCDLIERYFHSSETKFETAFEAAVTDYLKVDSVYKIPTLKHIKQRDRKSGGDVECAAMLLNYHNQDVKLKEITKKYFNSNSLKMTLELFGEYGLTARALYCEPQHLTTLNLPCIVQWELHRFVILTGFENGRAIVQNPQIGRVAYDLHEFAWKFTGIVLEIT